MKTDVFELGFLFDSYGATLTEKQQICFDLHYNQDLSLSEIASELGISRQGVHDTLARTESALRTMESQLGCVAQAQRLREAASLLTALADEIADPNAAKRIRDAVRMIEKE